MELAVTHGYGALDDALRLLGLFLVLELTTLVLHEFVVDVEHFLVCLCINVGLRMSILVHKGVTFLKRLLVVRLEVLCWQLPTDRAISVATYRHSIALLVWVGHLTLPTEALVAAMVHLLPLHPLLGDLM